LKQPTSPFRAEGLIEFPRSRERGPIEALAPRVAAGYGAQWPAERTVVDVVAYANWAGAYTTNDPTHVTVSSTDSRLEGAGALEILFHEVDESDSDLMRSWALTGVC